MSNPHKRPFGLRLGASPGSVAYLGKGMTLTVGTRLARQAAKPQRTDLNN